MQRASDLRAYIAARVPELKKNPANLHVFVSEGRIATKVGSLSFNYRYDVEIVVEDFTMHPDTLVVPILAWVAEFHPSLLFDAKRNDEIIHFKAELLDNTKYDIELKLEVFESVIVTVVDGKYRCEHKPDLPLPDLSGTPLRPPAGYPVPNAAGWSGTYSGPVKTDSGVLVPGDGTPEFPPDTDPENPFDPSKGGIVLVDIRSGEEA